MNAPLIPKCKKTGKNQYATRDLAIARAEYQMHIMNAAPLSVYQCPPCNMWHCTRRAQNKTGPQPSKEFV